MGKALTFCEIDYDFCQWRHASSDGAPVASYPFGGTSTALEPDQTGQPELSTAGTGTVGRYYWYLRLNGNSSVSANYDFDASGGWSLKVGLDLSNARSWKILIGSLLAVERGSSVLTKTLSVNGGDEITIPSDFILTVSSGRDAVNVYADNNLLWRQSGIRAPAALGLVEIAHSGGSSTYLDISALALFDRPVGMRDREQFAVSPREYAYVGCSASGGNAPCYNTRATCQVPDDYNPEPKVLRFIDPTDYAPVDIDAIPSIRQISTTPARIRPGDDLGERASISVGFDDHVYHDRQLDPYVSQRSYDPSKQGTYWGKWRARFPFYRTRAFRLIQGELGQPLREMESRHYVMDSIDGPTAYGQFTITAKDVLKLADDERAQAPRASKGALSGDITATATSATLTPSGIGNAEYPTSGRCVIGNEVCSFTRSGDNLTLTRGLSGTAAEEHSDGDTVQIVLRFDSRQASSIIHELLTEYATVPVRFIDLPEWQDEDTTYIGRLYGAEITEPTSVRELVAQLIEQVGLSIWWDEIRQKIQFKAIRQPDVPPAVVDDDRHFLAGSIKVKEQPKKRVSQVWVYYGVLDPTEDVDEPRNYRSVYVLGDADAESPEQYAEPQIRKVFARWISRFNQPGAADMAARILSRYRDAPRKFDFSLAWDSRVITLGSAYDAQTRLMQAPDGSIPRTRILVTSYERSTEQVNVESEEFLYVPPDDLGIKRVVVDADAYDVNARSAYDNIYPAVRPGDDVEIIVKRGAIVGSSTTDTPALDIGIWPSDVNITLIVEGRIQGMGGKGGTGTGAKTASAQRDGYPGGLALRTRYPITLNSSGQIWGGAGGGGGGGSVSALDDFNRGGGGGGGAGYAVGPGGDRGVANGFVAAPGEPGTTESGGGPGRGFEDGRNGGRGGDPAQPGERGDGGASGGAGGQPGNAIDGASYITVSSSGDIRGAQVN